MAATRHPTTVVKKIKSIKADLENAHSGISPNNIHPCIPVL